MPDPDSRRRLLDATKQLLWERGFEATSPRAVLEASGVGQGSLYHHFPTKKALAQAALEEISDALIADTEAVLGDSTRPPLDRLRTWLRRPRPGLKGCKLGRLAGEPQVFDAALHAPLDRYFGRLRALVAETLRDAQTAHQVPTDLDTEMIATTLVAAVQGGYILSRAQQDPAAVDQATAGAMALLERLDVTRCLDVTR